MHTTISRLVVVGDSIAEGLDDRWPDSEDYRGWADLVAARLAMDRPELEYANLAVRGKRLDQIVDEQFDRALAARPDLIALFGGVNDLLQRGHRPAVIEARVDDAVGRLAAGCPLVVVFTVGDVSRQTPLLRALRPRLAALNTAVRRAAAAHGAVVVELEHLVGMNDLRYFGADRFHLSAAGHRRVAAEVLRAIGVEADPRWSAPLDGAPVVPDWRSHLGWIRRQVVPTVTSRIRNVVVGRTPGDGFAAKRPVLTRVSRSSTDLTPAA